MAPLSKRCPLNLVITGDNTAGNFYHVPISTLEKVGSDKLEVGLRIKYELLTQKNEPIVKIMK